jgi:hypothetical protein
MPTKHAEASKDAAEEGDVGRVYVDGAVGGSRGEGRREGR